MKKILSLGVLLVTMLYALPLAYQVYAQGVQDTILQDVVQTSAQIEDFSVQAEDDGAVADVAQTAQDIGETQSSTIATADTHGTTIRVLVDEQIEEMSLEQYVAGVVAAEISPTFPAQALRAQAVAARTYAVYKMQTGGSSIAQHKGADVCADYHHCTAYMQLATQAAAQWGKQASTYAQAIEQAVADTAGEILTVQGKPIVAVFSAASGPKTEAAKNVWGSDISYLQSVDSPGGEACPKYQSEVTISAADFRKKVKETFPSAQVTGAPNTWFKASVRTQAGGIQTVQLGGVRVEGTAVRDMFSLNSTNFTLTSTADSITFHTTGYGHGVGLSQYGAKYMAEQGSDYQTILTHYYTGVQITKI